MKTGPLLTFNSISKTPIVALTVCRRIRIREDPSVSNWPTVTYIINVPTSSDSPAYKNPGEEHPFEKPGKNYFQVGEIAGYGSTPSGSSSFSQYED